MVRVNVVLMLLALLCAVGTVAGQHKARRLFHGLEREQERMRGLEVEWGQLQLEQSTWAAHARIEGIARERLQMRAPSPGQVVAVGAAAGSGR